MNIKLSQGSSPPIQPGLMVIHGNRLEALGDLLIAWLTKTPLAPLEEESLLVQSNGIGQWLKMAMARPCDRGGMGISAAVKMRLPGQFLWQAYRTVLGHDVVMEDSPFDKSHLIWRLMRLLPAQLALPDFAPLRHFLGDDGVDSLKFFQLASQVANLFDQYQVYRNDWLDDWAHDRDLLRNALRTGTPKLPDDQIWQAQLWRAVLADMAQSQCYSHRGAVHQAFIARVAELTMRPHELPRRLIVFGISSLPPQTLEVFSVLGRLCQVLLIVNNPCRHYWGDIIEDRQLLCGTPHRHSSKPGLPSRPQQAEKMYLHAHPLLAAWGKQGRDYIRLLDQFDTPSHYRPHFVALGRDIDLFIDPKPDNQRDTLLYQVQRAILNLEPLPTDPAQYNTLIPDDDSLRFHITHNRQREVEILHDNLLALFEQAERTGRPLTPRDIVVMVPDIDAYTPHIQAVFGAISVDDPRYLPYSIADRKVRGSTPLLVALEQLLHLPESRHSVNDILKLLDTPALRDRFNIDENDVMTLHRWIEEAGIAWALDGIQKQTFGLPSIEQNTWRFGLHRMLLGYAVGDGEMVQDIVPYANIDDLHAPLIGTLALLLERLNYHRRQLAGLATATEWRLYLHQLLHDFFDHENPHHAAELQHIYETLEHWVRACSEADFIDPLPLTVVREHWLLTLSDPGLSPRFLNGGVNFGTLLPMRAIPFRVVCLLGMNDDAFPHQASQSDIDLMGMPDQQRPGDRSRREDDRYLFLEALMAARDTLYISWIGRSMRDNSHRPPSVLVNELRNYLANGWTHLTVASEAPTDPLPQLTTVYPLQSFSADYFDNRDKRLFTYARQWQQVATPDQEKTSRAVVDDGLLPWSSETPLDPALLVRFLKLPARCFYNERLGVFFNRDQVANHHEPFKLDSLQTWQFTDDLLTTTLHAGQSTLTSKAERLRQQGTLPPGSAGALALTSIETHVQAIATCWHMFDTRHPRNGERHDLHYEAHGLVIEAGFDDLRPYHENSTLRLLTWASALNTRNGLRYDKLITSWVSHVLLNATHYPTVTHIVATDAQVRLDRLDSARARKHMDALLHAFACGMRTPLPIAPRTAFAWLQAKTKNPDTSHLMEKASQTYTSTRYSDGETGHERALARHWPDFNALHQAGFEQWLHLYQPLLESAHIYCE